MRARFGQFAADITRFGPLAIVSLATLLCLPSLLGLLGHRLAPTAMLERYLAALVFALVGVRLVQRALLSYAHHNLADAEQGALDEERGPRPEQA